MKPRIVPTIPLDVANQIISGAFAKARELDCRPMGFAVLDAGGHVLSFQREDGGAALRLQIASGKASGALAFARSSRIIEGIAQQYPLVVEKLDRMATLGIVAAPGGLLIGDGKGSILGAVGASGDTADNDELCARAGVEAAGLTPID